MFVKQYIIILAAVFVVYSMSYITTDNKLTITQSSKYILRNNGTCDNGITTDDECWYAASYMLKDKASGFRSNVDHISKQIPLGCSVVLGNNYMFNGWIIGWTLYNPVNSIKNGSHQQCPVNSIKNGAHQQCSGERNCICLNTT